MRRQARRDPGYISQRADVGSNSRWLFCARLSHRWTPDFDRGWIQTCPPKHGDRRIPTMNLSLRAEEDSNERSLRRFMRNGKMNLGLRTEADSNRLARSHVQDSNTDPEKGRCGFKRRHDEGVFRNVELIAGSNRCGFKLRTEGLRETRKGGMNLSPLKWLRRIQTRGTERSRRGHPNVGPSGPTRVQIDFRW